MLLRITNLQDVNRESMKYNHAYSLWITSVEHLQFLKMSTHHSTSDQDKGVWRLVLLFRDVGRNTGVVYTPPPPPPRPFMFVCCHLYTRSDHTMHKFGVAVHVRCSTRSSTSTQIGASKMNRLLFTLTVVVLMAAHGEYCTTLEFER